MADVISTVGKSVAEKALTEGSKGGAPTSGESDFSKVLNQKMGESDQMSKVMEALGVGPEKSMQVQSISAEGLEIDPAKLATAQPEANMSSKTVDMLTDVNRGALQMDNIIEMTTSGRKFNPAELLAMQAGMHKIALEIDLTGKVMEQANTGAKQLLQTNFA
jgi:hypothetical protein